MDPAEFSAILRHYFSEEVKQGWVFLVLGAVAAAAGSWLWKSHSAFRHALWPLLAVAAIQVAAGSMTLLRAPSREGALEASLSGDTAGFKAVETQRLARALDAFRFYKLAEIALVLVGIGLALFLPHNEAARGWAFGLLLEAALMLAADLVAEQRAEMYLDALRRL